MLARAFTWESATDRFVAAIEDAMLLECPAQPSDPDVNGPEVSNIASIGNNGRIRGDYGTFNMPRRSPLI